ncbi:hypothetical protein HOV93_01430 [Planctomycetes bacterium FF15]|uniref:Uncharacterized protein n=2 Tax=Bremerella alba TaxID=980252 RepID=A0A7V9A5A6_9BACT|nr:hypothetical protein [Bremerella alba]
MEPETIRKQSLSKAKKLGYPINPELPLLGDIALRRTPEQLLDRMLCLYTCVACSYGFPKQLGWTWLAQEGLLEKVTPEESLYLRNKDESPVEKFQPHVETIWAMTWVGQIQNSLEFDQTCTNDMVRLFPNLKASASSEAFRSKCHMRSLEEIASKLDLAYCLHWAITHETENQLELPKKPMRLLPYIIINRRHAMEWLFCDEPWDAVPMDID